MSDLIIPTPGGSLVVDPTPVAQALVDNAPNGPVPANLTVAAVAGAQTSGDPGVKAKYDVLSPLNHDGELYLAGTSITLEPKHAKQLLQAGVIRASLVVVDAGKKK